MNKALQLIQLCEANKVVFRSTGVRGDGPEIVLNGIVIGYIAISYGDSGKDTYYHPEFTDRQYKVEHRWTLGGRKLSYVKDSIKTHVLKLTEKFSSGMKNQGTDEYFEIFENPSKKEWNLCNANLVVRWIANLQTKQIWCWDGEKSIHRPVVKRLMTEQPEVFSDCVIAMSPPNKIVMQAGFPKWISGHTEFGESQSDIVDYIVMPEEAKYYAPNVKDTLAKKLVQLEQTSLDWLSKYIGDLTELRRDISDAADYALDLIGIDRSTPKPVLPKKDIKRFIGKQ